MQAAVMANQDPQQAARIAFQIQDATTRTLALTEIAPMYSKVNGEDSASWVKKGEKQLDGLPADVTKLKLLTSLAKVYFEQEQQGKALQYMNRAFDLGEELFEQDLTANPGKMAYTADGEEELDDLAAAAAQYLQDPNSVVTKVNSTENELLKAHLQVAAATGLMHRSKRD